MPVSDGERSSCALKVTVSCAGPVVLLVVVDCKKLIVIELPGLAHRLKAGAGGFFVRNCFGQQLVSFILLFVTQSVIRQPNQASNLAVMNVSLHCVIQCAPCSSIVESRSVVVLSFEGGGHLVLSEMCGLPFVCVCVTTDLG